jgi:glutamate--cysteine ligase regulatory subunit
LLKKLDVKAIDMLIVSFCGLRYREDEEDEEEGGHAPPTLDQIVQVWEALEKQVRMKRVHKLGVCEFSLPLLKAFCARVHVKPAVNQIRLADCCVLPRDLVEFAQEYQVELLNHSDERDLVPEPALTELLNQHLTRQQGHVGVCPRWLSKYSVVIPSRGVVSDKGFILAAQHVH